MSAQVIIAIAGMEGALCSVIGGLVDCPVIGVPIDGGPLKGMDALLSTVQMPGGVPVATVAIGKAGAKNAGYLAAQMLAVADDELAAKVLSERQKNAEEVMAKDAALQAQLK